MCKRFYALNALNGGEMRQWRIGTQGAKVKSSKDKKMRDRKSVTNRYQNGQPISPHVS